MLQCWKILISFTNSRHSKNESVVARAEDLFHSSLLAFIQLCKLISKCAHPIWVEHLSKSWRTEVNHELPPLLISHLWLKKAHNIWSRSLIRPKELIFIQAIKHILKGFQLLTYTIKGNLHDNYTRRAKLIIPRTLMVREEESNASNAPLQIP